MHPHFASSEASDIYSLHQRTRMNTPRMDNQKPSPVAIRERLTAQLTKAPLRSKRSMRTIGADMIESVLSPSGAPIVGLFLHFTYVKLLKSIARGTPFEEIAPAFIGIPALLSLHPGLSQAELADLMGIERATVGVHAQQCISNGLVKRKRSPEDRRKYELYVTPKGMRNLSRIQQLIPAHETQFFAGLSADELATLYRLLGKILRS
jgi:DNA-binding MarR family transcriptional regulator